MKLIIQTPHKAMKAFSKQKPLRSDIDNFKKHLISLLDKINIIEKRPTDESEEHLKNDLRDFLRDTYYIDRNAINTKDKKDLVIHLDKTTNSEVGVIIEAKRPNNVAEMVTAENPNKKALHELVLYYLDERNKTGNFQLKQLVITNINEWYIIDANYFDKYIYNNARIKTLYKTYKNDHKTNPWFYEEVSKIIATLDVEIPCVFFNIQQYNTILRNEQKDDDKPLSALYKILSAQHLLKQATPNDSNSLNEKFYKELLHIIGLEEAKEGGKNIIRRKKENPNPASLIEVAMDALFTNDPSYLQTAEGNTKEERVFNVALELCITWINRILFLKLMEGQLVNYHQGNQEYKFLNIEKVFDYDELFKLFHQVLALKTENRKESVKIKYSKVPYLNSSLFDISPLEDKTIKISALDNSLELDLMNTSILNQQPLSSRRGARGEVSLPTLNYLFQFLDAYDFASEGTDDIKEDKKELINASVLGKIFEKINGYKDGSIFTPAFITMYMCKQSIRLAVVEKFNEALSENGENKFDTFEDVKNHTSRQVKATDILKSNQIINSLRICDPAVGSGHFLVSALNEIISIKAELKILADDKGNSISNYEIEILDDELFITDPNNNDHQFEYIIQNGKPKTKEIQRLQKTLFHEKETIIENCLFGVDINPNSVKICSLRLWIELLKNAYYKEDTNYLELETLPNIDINIKCGNSLLSRFTLNEDLSNTLKSIKYTFDDYRGFVTDYKNATDKEEKKGLLNIIADIKNTISAQFFKDSKENKTLARTRGEYQALMFNRVDLFGTKLKGKSFELQKQRLEQLMERDEKIIADIKNNVVYKNAFEWRFEFPEVLNHNGDFEGFDLIIGNPPYFNLSGMKNTQQHFTSNFKTFSKGVDIYCLFLELSKNICSKNAQAILIISNKWRTASYGLKTRNFLATNVSDLSIVDFDKFQIFDGVSVDSGIISFTNNMVDVGNLKFKVKNKNQEVNQFLLSNQQVETLNLQDNNNWNLSGSKYGFIKQKIETNNKSISNLSLNLNRGITTGFNDAFIIDHETKAAILKQSPNATNLIKPLLRGRDIIKYSKVESNLWMIYIPKGFTIKNNLSSTTDANIVSEPSPRYGDMPIDEAAEWFKNNYFGIWRYLIQFKNQLINRLDKGDYWWELRACAYLDNFEKEKIIFTKASKIQAFTIDIDKNYLLNTSYFITGENLKYLLALLNSKLISFSFLNFYQGGGIEGEITLQALTQIPIPVISAKAQQPFIALVDKIIAQKQQGKDTGSLETQIDQLVYKLYDLTEEEIKIVEAK